MSTKKARKPYKPAFRHVLRASQPHGRTKYSRPDTRKVTRQALDAVFLEYLDGPEKLAALDADLFLEEWHPYE
jgi:hypothetical protein